MITHLDPSHPDVAAVMHLLDECDGCYVSDQGMRLYCNTNRKAENCSCHGTGRALHSDRIVGALRRWMWSQKAYVMVDWGHPYHEPSPDYAELELTTADGQFQGAFECGQTDEAYAIAYCRAARAVLEAGAQ